MSYLICSYEKKSLPPLLGREEESNGVINVLGALGKVSIADSYMHGIVELERNKRFNGIIFTGHSGDEGFYWGGDVIPAVELVSVISLASAEWIFLNSCKTDTFVAQINSYLPNVDIIATKIPIDDIRSVRAMRIFVSSLQSEFTVGAALRKAKLAMPGQEYVYYPKAINDVEKTETEQDKNFEKRLSDLELIVFGNSKMRIPGLQETMVQFSKTIEAQRWWLVINAIMTGFLILVFLWRNG